MCIEWEQKKIKTFSHLLKPSKTDELALRADGGKITRHSNLDGLRFIMETIHVTQKLLLQLLITVISSESSGFFLLRAVIFRSFKIFPIT